MTAAPIVVVGMHRSGTSLVASLLEACGVHLGDPGDLIPPAPDNPAGFWEHERITSINDRLLAEFGGGWDAPPLLAPDWHRSDRLGGLRAEAVDVVQRLSDHGTWGFKDPRVTLLLDFWADLCGPLRLVVCLRNPLEVARSLQVRNGHSVPLALRLWWHYHEALKASLEAEPDNFPDPVVTHYRAVIDDPASEMARLGDALGLAPASADRLSTVESRTDRGLRHHRLGGDDLIEAGADPRLRVRYRELCRLAAFDDGGQSTGSAGPTPEPAAVGSSSEAAALDDLIGRIDLPRLDHADLVSRYHVRGGHIALLEGRLAEAAARIVQLEDELRTSARTSTPDIAPSPGAPDLTSNGSIDGLLARLDDAALRVEAAAGDEQAARTLPHRLMRRLIERTEPDTRVGILGGCSEAPAGRYVNHVEPAVGRESLALLTAEGVDVVALPQRIDEDGSIGRRLEAFGWAEFASADGAGSLWRPPLPGADVDAQLVSLCDEIELRSGRSASVLDLTASAVGERMVDRAVFRADVGDPSMLLAGTVDLVLVDDDRPADGPADQHRAASVATAMVTGGDLRVTFADESGRVPTVSLVLTGMHPRFAAAVLSARPGWWTGEVVTDLDPASLAGSADGLTIVGGDGASAALGDLVDAASGEVIVCVSGMWLPTPSSLTPLVDALTHASVTASPAGLAVAATGRPDDARRDPVVRCGSWVDTNDSDWNARRADGPFGGPVVAISRSTWAEAGGFAPLAEPSTVAEQWCSLSEQIRPDWPTVWVPESRWVGFTPTQESDR